MSDNLTAKGSDRDYCSSYPIEGHAMESRSTGSKDVPWVEQCALCGWIDGEALQLYAEAAIKMVNTQRAQRLAVAASTEPFAFVEVRDHNTPLNLEEILLQALAAASLLELPKDLPRSKSIWAALKREVDLAIELEVAEARNAAVGRVREYMRMHFSQGTIEETVRAVEGPRQSEKGDPS